MNALRFVAIYKLCHSFKRAKEIFMKHFPKASVPDLKTILVKLYSDPYYSTLDDDTFYSIRKEHMKNVFDESGGTISEIISFISDTFRINPQLVKEILKAKGCINSSDKDDTMHKPCEYSRCAKRYRYPKKRKEHKKHTEIVSRKETEVIRNTGRNTLRNGDVITLDSDSDGLEDNFESYFECMDRAEGTKRVSVSKNTKGKRFSSRITLKNTANNNSLSALENDRNTLNKKNSTNLCTHTSVKEKQGVSETIEIDDDESPTNCTNKEVSLQPLHKEKLTLPVTKAAENNKASTSEISNFKNSCLPTTRVIKNPFALNLVPKKVTSPLDIEPKRNTANKTCVEKNSPVPNEIYVNRHNLESKVKNDEKTHGAKLNFETHNIKGFKKPTASAIDNKKIIAKTIKSNTIKKHYSSSSVMAKNNSRISNSISLEKWEMETFANHENQNKLEYKKPVLKNFLHPFKVPIVFTSKLEDIISANKDKAHCIYTRYLILQMLESGTKPNFKGKYKEVLTKATSLDDWDENMGANYIITPIEQNQRKTMAEILREVQGINVKEEIVILFIEQYLSKVSMFRLGHKDILEHNILKYKKYNIKRFLEKLNVKGSRVLPINVCCFYFYRNLVKALWPSIKFMIPTHKCPVSDCKCCCSDWTRPPSYEKFNYDAFKMSQNFKEPTSTIMTRQNPELNYVPYTQTLCKVKSVEVYKEYDSSKTEVYKINSIGNISEKSVSNTYNVMLQTKYAESRHQILVLCDQTVIIKACCGYQRNKYIKLLHDKDLSSQSVMFMHNTNDSNPFCSNCKVDREDYLANQNKGEAKVAEVTNIKHSGPFFLMPVVKDNADQLSEDANVFFVPKKEFREAITRTDNISNIDISLAGKPEKNQRDYEADPGPKGDEVKSSTREKLEKLMSRTKAEGTSIATRHDSSNMSNAEKEHTNESLRKVSEMIFQKALGNHIRAQKRKLGTKSSSKQSEDERNFSLKTSIPLIDSVLKHIHGVSVFDDKITVILGKPIPQFNADEKLILESFFEKLNEIVKELHKAKQSENVPNLVNDIDSSNGQNTGAMPKISNVMSLSTQQASSQFPTNPVTNDPVSSTPIISHVMSLNEKHLFKSKHVNNKNVNSKNVNNKNVNYKNVNITPTIAVKKTLTVTETFGQISGNYHVINSVPSLNQPNGFQSTFNQSIRNNVLQVLGNANPLIGHPTVPNTNTLQSYIIGNVPSKPFLTVSPLVQNIQTVNNINNITSQVLPTGVPFVVNSLPNQFLESPMPVVVGVTSLSNQNTPPLNPNLQGSIIVNPPSSTNVYPQSEAGTSSVDFENFLGYAQIPKATQVEPNFNTKRRKLT